MVDQPSIKGNFGAPGKQLKRKAKPSAKSTEVNETKKQTDSPTVRV